MVLFMEDEKNPDVIKIQGDQGSSLFSHTEIDPFLLLALKILKQNKLVE